MESAIQIFLSVPPILVEPSRVDKSLGAFWRSLFQAYAHVTQKYGTIKTILIPSVPTLREYEVYDAESCSPIGLSLITQCSETGTEWYVYYKQAKQLLAGPYDFKEEAELMAALLASFDWTRPASQFSRRELHLINRLIIMYRDDIKWFKNVMVEAWAEYYLPFAEDAVADAPICLVH